MTKTQHFEFDTKPSLFQRVPVFLKILFLGSKPNFPTQRITATTCKRGTYNDLHLQNHKKSKPNPNPIQTQFQTQSQLSTVTCLPFSYLRPKACLYSPLSTVLLSRANGPPPISWRKFFTRTENLPTRRKNLCQASIFAAYFSLCRSNFIPHNHLKTRIAEFFYLFYHLSENTPCNTYWNFA